ncbi:hypothetical protein FACS1894172_02030 [Spirochaetia bacterium]|nr:hypothetical protein FACS1894172_02030 [Spirochaetia bacterium]
MPSITDLKKFSDSLRNVAHETEVLKQQGRRPVELALPDAKPMMEPETPSQPDDVDAIDFSDLLDTIPMVIPDADEPDFPDLDNESAFPDFPDLNNESTPAAESGTGEIVESAFPEFPDLNNESVPAAESGTGQIVESAFPEFPDLDNESVPAAESGTGQIADSDFPEFPDLNNESVPAAESGTGQIVESAFPDFPDLNNESVPVADSGAGQIADSDFPEFPDLNNESVPAAESGTGQIVESAFPEFPDLNNESVPVADSGAGQIADSDFPEFPDLNNESVPAADSGAGESADSDFPDLNNESVPAVESGTGQSADADFPEFPDLNNESAPVAESGTGQSADADFPDFPDLDSEFFPSAKTGTGQVPDSDSPDLDNDSDFPDFPDLNNESVPVADSGAGESADSDFPDFPDLNNESVPVADSGAGESADSDFLEFPDLNNESVPVADSGTGESAASAFPDFPDLDSEFFPSAKTGAGQSADSDSPDLDSESVPVAESGTGQVADSAFPEFPDLNNESVPAVESGTGQSADADFPDFPDLDSEFFSSAKTGTGQVPDSDSPDLDSESVPAVESGTGQSADSDFPEFPDLDSESAPVAESGTGQSVDADFPEFPDLDSESAPAGDFSLSDLPDFAEPDTVAPAGDFSLSDLPDFAKPDTVAPAGDFSLSDLPDFAEPDTVVPAGDFSLSDLPDFAKPDTVAPAGDFSLSDLPDFAEPDDGKSVEALSGFGAFVPFDGGASSLATDFQVSNEYLDEPDGDFIVSDEEDTLPSIDDALSDSVLAEIGKASDDVEEVELSEADLARLQNTLSRYPLNLRIACEEIIAEQLVSPESLSKLLELLKHNAPPLETAALAEKILKRSIIIPAHFEKRMGEELEAEQASFSYIFIHKFVPIIRTFLLVAIVAASVFYLSYRFIYTPLHANSLYKKGYTELENKNYEEANKRFAEAVNIHRIKKWFFKYAEGFRNDRQYALAEKKYDELLWFYPHDKQGALAYADMETNNLLKYQKADEIIRQNILNYQMYDREGLLAAGDNDLLWGDEAPEHYEDAREAYAKLLEKYKWKDPYVERMLLYLIRTDNLKEVLNLQNYFMDPEQKRKISASTLSELGGYLLDKKLEKVSGVPDEYIGNIDGLRDVLLKAVAADPKLPESYYHLARYYNYYNDPRSELQVLDRAVQMFDEVSRESKSPLPRPKAQLDRIKAQIDTYYRYGEALIRNRNFLDAEEELKEGVKLYEDAMAKKLFDRSPEFGRLYADLGDIAYFHAGNMDEAIKRYSDSKDNGWAPPEIQYRIGSAYYNQQEWGPALEYLFAASTALPLNRRILNALGNVSYMRGNYYAAHGYYSNLLSLLNVDRTRFSQIVPQESPEQRDLAERLMYVNNNLAVTSEVLAEHTGNDAYRSNVAGLYTESDRAWDALNRNPDTMQRVRQNTNLASQNFNYTLRPTADYQPQIFTGIDKDALEPSLWEELMS